MAGKKTNMPTWELSKISTVAGRTEVVDPAVFDGFNLRLSEAVAQRIQRLEESVVTAEQRLGLFRVG